MTRDEEKLLRDSVPDHWKGTTSPIGGAQSYIAELEGLLCEARDMLRSGVINDDRWELIRKIEEDVGL